MDSSRDNVIHSIPALQMFKDNFVTCAKSYKFHGLPVHELCDHNYKVSPFMHGDLVRHVTWKKVLMINLGGMCWVKV